ncbi:MAG: DUF4412 domain-containing protein [Bacteroidetes bacterium]|nr:DUF4412 domain-containing protein [Bacteroidota bacterium]
MKSIYNFLFCLLISTSISAQGFEGTIEFKKQTEVDTSNYMYYVKGSMIRVDEVGAKYENTEGSFLIDTKAEKITAVSHQRKSYFDQPVKKYAGTATNFEIIKTKNTKVLHNYKCTEYIVKNKAENTQVAYWMAPGGFGFFSSFMKVLNRKEKISQYYLRLTGTDGMFPFLAIESSLSGTEIGRLEVTKIQKKVLDDGKFQIPTGYKKSID